MEFSFEELSGSLSLRSCWGFSFGTRQAAVTIPLSTRQQPLGCHFTPGYLLVHSLGSWCVVRGVAPGAPPRSVPAASAANERAQLVVEGNASESQLSGWSIGKGDVPHPPADTEGRTRLSVERVFTRHSNKVSLLTYSPALDVCLSAEQPPAGKGGGLQTFCRIWSPYSLRELCLIQLPSPHDVTAAHFSDDGHVLLLLLADPQHSLAIYMGVLAALQRDRIADADSTAFGGTPVLLAQEGLVQLLPLASLTSPSQVRQAVSGPPATPLEEIEVPKPELSSLYTKRALTLHRSPYGSARVRRERRPASCNSRHKGAASRLQSAGSATPTLVPPFATGSLDAPSRTPRSTYGDTVGRGYAAHNRRYRHSTSAGSQRSALLRNSSKALCQRASSTDSQASTRSSTGVYTVHQEREQRRPTPPRAGPAQKGKQAASTSWLQPKRSLTTQEVATRCMKWGELQEGSLWWPLHSSQVVALHWNEPTLLLCTRTQIVAVDSSNLSKDASKVLQERPLGNIDVAALLCLSSPPVSPHCIKSGTGHCIISDQDVAPLSPRTDSRMNILVAGGRCCVGGELRLWELQTAEQSTPPFYFKAPVTAVDAGLVEEGDLGVVAVGTEDGHLILLIVRRQAAGQLESPSVVWDRQISPRAITALSIDRKGSLLAAGSASGQIDCFRLLVSASKNGSSSADRCVQGDLVGRASGFRHSSATAKSSNVLVEPVLQTILHAPFSTPPRVLKFGQTSDTEEHILVAGANAPACVCSISEGRVLSCSVFVVSELPHHEHLNYSGKVSFVALVFVETDSEAAKYVFQGGVTDSFAPLFIPVPVALGPSKATVPLDSFVELLHQIQPSSESRARKILQPPAFLTNVLRSRQQFFAFDNVQRRLYGMIVERGKRDQEDVECSSRHEVRSLTSIGSEKTGSQMKDCTEVAPLNNNRVSQFHRGAGLASLFRDLGSYAETSAIPKACSLEKSSSHPHLSATSEAHGASAGGRGLQIPRSSVCVAASAKLPHNSSPTALFCCPDMRSAVAAESVKHKLKQYDSAGIISAAPEGYLLVWDFELNRSPAKCRQKEDFHVSNDRQKFSAQQHYSTQSCNPVRASFGGESKSLRTGGMLRNKFASSSSVSGQLPGQAASAEDIEETSFEMPTTYTTYSGSLTPYIADHGMFQTDVRDMERASLIPSLKPNSQLAQRVAICSEVSHKFLYRAVEHHSTYEVEVTLPGGVIEQVRREFVSNTLVFSGRLDDPSWRIQLSTRSGGR
ncbi:hypothetical protein Esti_004882 [Eimeria stiedai]